jgi:hypothetical protein
MLCPSRVPKPVTVRCKQSVDGCCANMLHLYSEDIGFKSRPTVSEQDGTTVTL